MIRWTRSDYMKLSSAVRKFNKTIKQLETEENKLQLPELIDYKDIKEKIFTRAELKRRLNALHRFNKETEQQIIKTETGVDITKWEYKELKKEKKRAERRLETRLIEVKEENVGKRIGFKTSEEKEIEATLKSLNKLYSVKGYDFIQLKRRLHKIGIGVKDYDLWRKDIYRQNYYEALKGVKNFKNYKLLKNKLDSIKNPIEFFDYIQQNDILSDLFLYYKSGDGLVYGSFANNEDAFNYALEQLGLI